MPGRLKSLFPALCLLAVPAAFGAVEGDVAPDFTLPVLGDDSTMSLAGSHGKVRYIDFRAFWCAHCRVSIPSTASIRYREAPTIIACPCMSR